MVTKGNVLVVDDEINLCRIIGAKLSRNGYNVVTVHDGMQAVERVRESDFDVVLLDLILPKMDGLSALAEIRGIRSSLPVIIMTACENPDAVEKAKTFGVSGYVNKPFDLDSLMNLISTTSQAGHSEKSKKLPDSTVLFAAGHPVMLELQNGCGVRLHTSRIINKDDNTLSVLAPVNYKAISLRSSAKVGLTTVDAYYSFTSQVIGVEDSSEPVLILDKPSVIYRVQRREHPRFSVKLPVSYAISDDEEQLDYKQGETRDLSLGGACIIVPEEILPGEMLRVELQPKTMREKVSAFACVTHSNQVCEAGKDGYAIGCKFVLAEGPLEKLLTFC